MAVSVVAAALALTQPSADAVAAASIWTGALLLATVALIVRRILSFGTVTGQSILGAVSAYMIVGLMFAAFYAAIAQAGRRALLRGRADGEHGDLPVLQLHHADDARVRGFHRRGQ